MPLVFLLTYVFADTVLCYENDNGCYRAADSVQQSFSEQALATKNLADILGMYYLT
jgi:hypothetical protein